MYFPLSKFVHFVFSFPPNLPKKTWKAILRPVLFFSVLFFLGYYFVNLSYYNEGISTYHSGFFGRTTDLIILMSVSLYYTFLFLLFGLAVGYVLHFYTFERQKLNFAIILITMLASFFLWPYVGTVKLYLNKQIINTMHSSAEIQDKFIAVTKNNNLNYQYKILNTIVLNPHTSAKTLDDISKFYHKTISDRLDPNFDQALKLIRCVLGHKNISLKTLKKYIDYKDLTYGPSLIEYILENPSTPAEIINTVWEKELNKNIYADSDLSYDKSLVYLISLHPNTSSLILADIHQKMKAGIIDRQYGVIEKHLALNKNTPTEISKEVWDNFNYDPLQPVLLYDLEYHKKEPNVSPEVLTKAANKILDGTLRDFNGVLKSALIHNPNTPKDMLNKLKQIN